MVPSRAPVSSRQAGPTGTPLLDEFPLAVLGSPMDAPCSGTRPSAFSRGLSNDSKYWNKPFSTTHQRRFHRLTMWPSLCSQPAFARGTRRLNGEGATGPKVVSSVGGPTIWSPNGLAARGTKACCLAAGTGSIIWSRGTKASCLAAGSSCWSPNGLPARGTKSSCLADGIALICWPPNGLAAPGTKVSCLAAGTASICWSPKGLAARGAKASCVAAGTASYWGSCAVESTDGVRPFDGFERRASKGSKAFTAWCTAGVAQMGAEPAAASPS